MSNARRRTTETTSPYLQHQLTSSNLPPASVAWLLSFSIPALTINPTHHPPHSPSSTATPSTFLHQLTSSSRGMAPALHHQPHSPSTATPSSYLQQAWHGSFLAPSPHSPSTALTNSINLPPATVGWLLPFSIPALTINCTHHLQQPHQLTSSNRGMAPSLLHPRTHHLQQFHRLTSNNLTPATVGWLISFSIPALTINRNPINLPPATVAWLLPFSVPALTIINPTHHLQQLHRRSSSNLPPATVAWLLPFTINRTHHLQQLHQLTSSNLPPASVVWLLSFSIPALTINSTHHPPHSPSSTATPSTFLQQLTSSNHGVAPALHHQPHSPSTATLSTYLIASRLML